MPNYKYLSKIYSKIFKSEINYIINMAFTTFDLEWLGEEASGAFKASQYYYGMTVEWIGNHSVSSPAPLTGSEIRKILGTSHVNANALHDRETSMKNQIRLELSSFPIKISISDEEKFLETAIKVKGPVPLKVAVALYAFDLIPVEKIEAYLQAHEINKDRNDLYSLCWRYGISKVRHKPSFDEVLRKYPLEYNALIAYGYYNKAKEIFEKNLSLGKNYALKVALQGVGMWA